MIKNPNFKKRFKKFKTMSNIVEFCQNCQFLSKLSKIVKIRVVKLWETPKKGNFYGPTLKWKARPGLFCPSILIREGGRGVLGGRVSSNSIVSKSKFICRCFCSRPKELSNKAVDSVDPLSLWSGVSFYKLDTCPHQSSYKRIRYGCGGWLNFLLLPAI